VEFTIDELTALTLTHGRAANHARKAAELLLKVADENDNLAQIYLEAGKRIGREAEAKESKVKLRSIITSVLVLVLMSVFLMGGLTLAQDTPAQPVAVTASINGQPVEATLEPVTHIINDYPADVTLGTGQQPVNGATDSNTLNTVLDKVILIIAIVGLLVLTFKTAGLVPRETFDSAIAKAFALAKELTMMTATPIDDAALDLIKPGLTKWLEDELAKRANGITVNVQNPADITGFGTMHDALRQAGVRPDGK